MGIEFFHDRKSPYCIDAKGLSILDIGGGPTSLLLKCINLGQGVVVDPLPVPEWVLARYEVAGIEYRQHLAEIPLPLGFDECWIYNVLQHVDDPELVIIEARKAAKLIRLFEWVNASTNIGHLHILTKARLDAWLGGEGKTEELVGQHNCYGRAYYGVFPTT